jgi:hypothetical protein
MSALKNSSGKLQSKCTSPHTVFSQISCVVWMLVPLTNPDWEVTEIVVIGVVLCQKIYKNRTMIITNIMKWYNIEYFKPR